MTTTRIYFEPYASATSANGYATYDLEGSVKDSALNEYLETSGGLGHSRINNNTYRWISSGGVPNGVSYETFTIKLDATNWPLESNASNLIYNTVSYTFSSGNTIPAAQQGIRVRGRYISERAWNFGDEGLARYTLQSHQGNTATITARTDDLRQPEFINLPTVTIDEVTKQYSPYATYYITSTQALTNYFETGTTNIENYFDGDYAGDYVADQSVGGYVLDDYIAPEIGFILDDTRTNVKFFVHSIQGHSGGGGETSLDVRYEYEYRLIWQVNLHSVSSSISSDTNFANILAGLSLIGNSTITAESQAEAVAGVTIAVEAQAQSEFSLGAVGGQLLTGAATLDIATTTTFSGGRTQPLAATATIESDFTASGNRTPGGTVSESIDTQAQAEVKNIIGISDGTRYTIDDYADPDYFIPGQPLVLQTISQMQADANIIRSDGTIVFDAAFDATIRPGFRIDGGVITAGSADFTIAPYITGGVGLLFAGAADLQAEAAIAQAQFGLRIDAIAEIFDTQVEFALLAGNQISSGYEFAPTTISLSAEAESRPSIKVSLTIGDDGSLTAEAFVDNSSTALLDIGPFTVGPAVAGYLLSADVEILQEINSTFGETETRIFYIDMYYASVVAAETRQYPAAIEARIVQPDPETRVNTCRTESRQFPVDPETRQAEIAILPTTLRDKKLFRIPV